MENITIKQVAVLSNMRLLVIFDNGTLKIYDGKQLPEYGDKYRILEDPDVFGNIYIEAGGYGLAWNNDVDVSEWELWKKGITVPLTEEDISALFQDNLFSTSDICDILHCTRQYVGLLSKSRKLKPLVKIGNNKLFLKSDVLTYKKLAERIAYSRKYSDKDLNEIIKNLGSEYSSSSGSGLPFAGRKDQRDEGQDDQRG